MRMKREGGKRRKFGGTGGIATDNSQIKLFAKKNLRIKLFARKFKHIYCKYLHGK